MQLTQKMRQDWYSIVKQGVLNQISVYFPFMEYIKTHKEMRSLSCNFN
jgi:hypothetical protein